MSDKAYYYVCLFLSGLGYALYRYLMFGEVTTQENVIRVLVFLYFFRWIISFLIGNDMYIPRHSEALKKGEDDKYRLLLMLLGLICSSLMVLL